MGVKFWFIVYSDGDAREHLKSLPKPDTDASLALAETLFGCEMVPQGTTSFEISDPRGKNILVGVYPGVTIVAAEDVALDRPSGLSAAFLDHGRDRRVTLHAQHSVVDWTAFAWWEHGELKRSLSVSPDDGIIEDIGERLPFEDVFWDPPEDIYDEDSGFPYGHPLELGEHALAHFIGTQYEGYAEDWLWDTTDLEILSFKTGRKKSDPNAKPFWKFW
ncbi:MAG: hypothetical protein HKN27_14310 [Silicimonas sp.]|nr:hypothetical protein [Silicimonas sp.]